LDDRQCWTSIEITIIFRSGIPERAGQPGIGDYAKIITRHLSEVKWRLTRVRGLPINLSIRILVSRRANLYTQGAPAMDMVRKFIRTTFGPNGMGPQINSYEEDGYRLFRRNPYSFFNNVISVMQPNQYERTLTSLQLRCARLQNQLKFPNLTDLVVYGYADALETLSKIIAPALESIRVRDLANNLQRQGGEAPGILYLAPLIARFPKLRDADFSETFSTNFLHPKDW
jgi:hypothetical protein